MKVSCRAPSATPNRAISAKPRVISAARALSPNVKPSHKPVAIASTFFTAPPTSTPTQSSLPYSRRASVWKAFTNVCTTVASGLAATNAVGSPFATSCAKLGPLSTPVRKSGANVRASSCPSKPADSACTGFSKPLHSQATGAWALASERRASCSRKPAMGVAITTNCASLLARTKSPV